MKEIPLYKLQEGSTGVVTDTAGAASGAVGQRLEDLGVIPGTRIKCLFRSPLGDPVAYEIRGSVIALRREDSGGVLVEPEETGEPEVEPAQEMMPVQAEPESDKAADGMIIALAGNPNVGKSTVFNTLTGLRQHTGNWAGKTVTSAAGIWKLKEYRTDPEAGRGYRNIQLVDIPGCYSLEAASREEEVARDYLCSGKCSGVIVVCDGTCLERNLILVLQILKLAASGEGTGGGKEQTVPLKVALCINMMDQAEKQGVVIDGEKLSQILGIPVCMTQSRRPKEMRRQLEEMVRSRWTGDHSRRTEEILRRTAAAWNLKEASGRDLVLLAEQAASETVYRPEDRQRADRKLDRMLTSPLTGFPAMGLLLLAVFWITLRGANYPSAWLGDALFSLEEPLFLLLRDRLALPAAVCEMTVFGMYRVLAWVVSVMLPPMAIFFPLFTLLEDWGFLPRVAFNLDRCFHCCRACGKQALTLCMGFGCNASAVVGSRIIESRRERLLAMVTNSLTPCNGRFPVLIAVIAMFFAGGQISWLPSSLAGPLLLTGVVLLSIAASLLLTKILSHTILSGTPSAFALELPPFRRPQIGKVLLRSLLDRTLLVLARAAAVAAPAGLLIYILAGAGILEPLAAFLDPLGRFIGLDGVILLAFLLGLPANEIVLPVMMMIYMHQENLAEVADLDFFYQILAENGWTGLTAVNMLVFTLMHWPCATAIWSVYKESGSWKWTLVSILAPFFMGCLFCFTIKSAYCFFLA